MRKYYTVEISAESQVQADSILNSLLERKLVTGGQFIKTPARFLWEGKLLDMDYMTITSFTVGQNKQAVTETVEANSEESVPMIRFMEFEGNAKLTAWIEQTLL
jgi:uncharacterized protein involved in tolerance to divalent cations